MRTPFFLTCTTFDWGNSFLILSLLFFLGIRFIFLTPTSPDGFGLAILLGPAPPSPAIAAAVFAAALAAFPSAGPTFRFYLEIILFTAWAVPAAALVGLLPLGKRIVLGIL